MKRDIPDRLLSKLETRLQDYRAELPSDETRQSRLTRYAADPVAFARTVLGAQSHTRLSTGEPYQFTLLEAVATHENTVMRSGHGVGKTATLAMLALWWVTTRADALVVILAPTLQRQARGIIAAETQRWARRGGIELRSDGAALHLDDTRSRIVLVSASAESEQIEGWHGRSVLLMIDEAKGVTREAIDAVSGVLTAQEFRVVMTSTPSAPTGPFFDACMSEREATLWHRLHIPSDDCSAVNPQYIARQKRAWSEQSATYRQRVRGEFPADGDGTMFPWSLLSEATDAELPPSVRETVRGTRIGVDLARSAAGDRNAAMVVRDGVIVHVEQWHSADLMESVSRVQRLVRTWGPDLVTLDETGVGGGAVDRLRQLTACEVQGVQFGARALDSERFTNRRAELLWSIRARLVDRSLSLPSETPELNEELAAIRVLWDGRGRIGATAKSELRGELGRSIDLADALGLATCPRLGPLPEQAMPFLTVGPVTFIDEGLFSDPNGAAMLALELGLLD
ncbi:MAG: terminase large subunit domain-containing protein [Gemmatimonas sp.]|jgi:hypothetical protein|uniref:terminase large subunit domain-containing protein n=1 Tax=Gemmatimonas sp. TaxID=1962908 RepID=UPI00391F2A17